MLMKMLRVAAVLSIIIVVLGIVGINLVLSVKEDASAMREENLGVFLVSPGSSQVELAVVLIQSTGETVLLKNSQQVGGTSLREVFRDSEKEGAYSLVGTELEGYVFSDGSVSTRMVRVDRVAVVEDTVLEQVLRPAGEQRIVQEFGSLSASTTLDAGELVEMLRGNMDAVTWKVRIDTPLLSVERSVKTSELLRMAETAGVEVDEELIKAYVLAEFGSQASPVLRENQKQTIVTVLSAYRQGKLRIYPENTLTRALRYLPESLLLKMVGAA
ncbi:MAG: hypothetical protein GXN98_00485 [Euryarchaeota archaeon]|nr:hypothetical protein [Euryarchaeota archaeon]